jgi:hypothetical protein
MINFYYHPGYVKRSKKIFTIKLRESVLINKFIDIAYFFNLIFPNRFITNGTHKCINNTLRALKGNAKYNKHVYSNSYIVQFDWFGEQILKQIIDNNASNKKVLVGPLYTDKQLKSLSKYIQNYNFIKVVAASNYSTKKILSSADTDIKKKDICVIPTGVISKNSKNRATLKNRNKKCLIYYKNRSKEDLLKVIKFLNSRDISYDLFEYGKYSNSKLIKAAKNNRFCILLNSAESQGIAVQEVLSMNLPIYVWDLPSDKLNHFGSSTPYFDERCGVVVNSYNEFLENFQIFIKNLDLLKPREFILEELTYEKFFTNLQNQFDEINL